MKGHGGGRRDKTHSLRLALPRLSLHKHTHTHNRIHTHTQSHTHTHTIACIHRHTQTHTHAHPHTHTDTHIHARTNTQIHKAGCRPQFEPLINQKQQRLLSGEPTKASMNPNCFERKGSIWSIEINLMCVCQRDRLAKMGPFSFYLFLFFFLLSLFLFF